MTKEDSMDDDGEVTRQAIAISISTWAQLAEFVQSGRKDKSDVDILKAYIRTCPFVGPNSASVILAFEALERAGNVQGTKKTVPDNTLATAEAAHCAMRIAISAWSHLLVQTETLAEREILKKYIQLCPYMSSNSTAIITALHGLEATGREEASAVHPPPLDNVESDSDDSDAGKERTSDTADSTNPSPDQKSTFRPLIFVARSILLDLPMVLLFVTYLGLLWVHRVDQRYIKPSMDAAFWTVDRAEKEITYYERECDAQDVTTRNPDDILIPKNASVQEAYEHQLLHGFSIFQEILTEDVMHDLRSYVISRNRKLTEEESIFVIENTNRYSFGLGTEVPCVARAVEQLANHERLAPALEKILGPNPALIEMTAITASYGAISQHWHDDVVAQASVMKYGRTFGPSYSVFIQLQNTTKEMGATETCPGSHYCSKGEIEAFCEREGFHAVNSSTGYWRAGDALLMNMNSYHRGTAHTDPNAPDRVMLILVSEGRCGTHHAMLLGSFSHRMAFSCISQTFVPKPQELAESRQMSQGITFSLRWDLWGHTLYDLQKASTRMRQPWATLRALGLYKPKDAAWGVDYVSGAIMRISNEDNGFRSDEFVTFLERGGFRWLPAFIQGQVSDDGSWEEFLVDTLERSVEFMGYVNGFVSGLYVLLLCVALCMSPNRSGLGGVARSLLRTTVLYTLVFAAWQAANNHVDNTHWAKDIVAGRRYGPAFSDEDTTNPAVAHIPSTMPNRKDVLIETRYASKQLHMYNDFTNGHPGNRIFQALVREYTIPYTLAQSDLFQRATAAYIVSVVSNTQGRFLLQEGNEWLWLSTDEAINFARAELVVEGSPAFKMIRQSVRFSESDYKYGHCRGTALARMSLGTLRSLSAKLLSETPLGTALFVPTAMQTVGNKAVLWKKALSKIRKAPTIPKTTRPLLELLHRRCILDTGDKPREPRIGAWLKAGDIVEGTEVMDNGDAYWYKGRLHKVTAAGDFFVTFDSAESSVIGAELIRVYKPYQVGEKLEVFLDDDEYEVCRIVKDNMDDTYDVYLAEEKRVIEAVPTADLRRPRKGKLQSAEREVRNHYK
jgi:Phytanoyl-CoA dioxygenase (PhyH)